MDEKQKKAAEDLARLQREKPELYRHVVGLIREALKK